MGDHYRGTRYLFLLGRGAVLTIASSVGDLANTLPCGGQSLSVGDSRCLLVWTVGGFSPDQAFCLIGLSGWFRAFGWV